MNRQIRPVRLSFMKPLHALTLGLTLLLGAQAQTSTPAAPASAAANASPAQAARPEPGKLTTSFGTLPADTNNRDVRVALRAPGFAGVWVNAPGVMVAVTTDDPAQRQAILKALEETFGRETLEVNTGNVLAKARFTRVKYDALQLAQVRHLAHEFRGWQSIGVDGKANRVRVDLSLPAYRAQAEALLRARGIPLDTVALNAPESPLLPQQTTLKHPLKAVLVAPAQVAQGDLLTLAMPVTNLGKTDLSLNIVCAYQYRVIRVDTGEAVRPVPAPGACPSLAASVVMKPGETKDALVSPWKSGIPPHWDLRDVNGKFVPPGKYVLQLAHGDGQFAIRPADVPFTVLPAAKGGGMEQIVKKLPMSNMPEEPVWEPEFVTVGGVQRLRFTVPDERAKKGVIALAKARGVPLSGVDFRVLPTPPMPPAGTDAQVKLKVYSMGNTRAPQQNFEARFQLGAAKQVIPGAKSCELVFMVRRVANGEIVHASSQTTFAPYRFADGPQKCLTGAILTQHGGWRGRLTDGQPAPAGPYEVRAGLRVTAKDGRVTWLSAKPQVITLK